MLLILLLVLNDIVLLLLFLVVGTRVALYFGVFWKRMTYDFMKEDWDTKIIRESSVEHLDGIKANPFKNSRFFFGFDINVPGKSFYSKFSKKKGSKRIFYYGKSSK